jgi:hypothetical protein
MGATSSKLPNGHIHFVAHRTTDHSLMGWLSEIGDRCSLYA